MDIYKLKDFDADFDSDSDSDSKGEAFPSKRLVITNLKQGVKNPDRVNVFIDEEFSFSLDITQVVDLRIKVGQEITEERLSELKRESEYGKMYQRTLEWVLLRPRSEREVREYLFKKLRIPASETLLEKLISKGYVDDRKFAEYYVQNRFVKKGISKKRLALELMKKGIKKDIIDEVLGTRDDEDEIDKVIFKKRKKYTDEKLIQYLLAQGFPYDLVREKVLESGKD